MNSSLDLNLLHLARQGGNEKNELPDMYAVTPPRRAAHGRETESLIIYLSMTGNSPLAPESHAQILQQLAHKYYDTPGSLTSALRSVAEGLNQYLLDRNLRSTSAGRQGIGQLILVALRADSLYIAQCGNVHVFLLTLKETQDLYDPQSSGRGLGLSRTTAMRFLQTKMDPDDYLILATQPTPEWVSSLPKHPKSGGIEALRHQLMGEGNQDFNAVIIQAQAGTGKLKLLKRKTETAAMAHPPTGAQPIQTENFGQPTEDKGLGVSTTSTPAMDTNGNYALYPDDKKLGIPSSSPTATTVKIGEEQSPASNLPGAVIPTQTMNQRIDANSQNRLNEHKLVQMLVCQKIVILS